MRSFAALRMTAVGPTVRLLSVVAAVQPGELALDLDPVGSEDPRLIGGVGGLERDRGALLAQALQGRFSVASVSSIRATTISPDSAVSALLMMAMSPLWMPASTIESPCTSRQ